MGGPAPVRVVYIGGVGHSGSTVLDIALSGHPQIEGAGELGYFARSWLSGERCACGARVDACGFWAAVRREWCHAVGSDDLREYEALRFQLERNRHWRRLPVEARRQSPSFSAYARWADALFRAVCTVSGRSIVVDSSKHPARALALALVPTIDLRLVHLVRDPRGVAWSLMRARRRRPISSWRSALLWSTRNLFVSDLRRRLGPRRAFVVRYEDLVAAPRGVLTAIGDVIEEDLSGIGRTLAAGGAVPVRHTVAGNPLRNAGEVRLQADLEWKAGLGPADRRMTRMIAGRWMRRYGYDP
jgi:hypothetical protein